MHRHSGEVMPYVKPVDFSASTKLLTSTYQADADAARVYLHQGITGADIAPTNWCQTRHLVGPAEFSPAVGVGGGVQHGISGHQGGQNGLMSLSRFTFACQTLNNSSDGEWAIVPLTSTQIEMRRPATVILHWWAELLAGPDNRAYSGFGDDERAVWIKPFIGDPSQSPTSGASVTVNNINGWDNSSPYSVQPDKPWEYHGWGDMEGSAVLLKASSLYIGRSTIGLAAWTTLSRAAFLNWGFSIETHY